MKIGLTKGRYTKVDPEDFEYLNQWRWQYGASGYAVRDEYLGKIEGKYRHRTLLMHRVLMDVPSGMDIDHINRDKLDNRKGNLRIATRSQNRANIDPIRRLNTELPMGVTYNPSKGSKQPYMARICLGGRSYFLGNFCGLEDAARAYRLKKKQLYGEFAD